MTAQNPSRTGTSSVPFCGDTGTTGRNRGFQALFRKELADHLNGNRFYLIFGLLLVAAAVSLSGAAGSLRDSGTTSTEFLFLRLFTTSSSSIYSFATWLAFLGPLAGITLGFDAVCNERSQGTLNRLAAQPIYRDSIINAKFAAGATVLLLVTASLTLLFTGGGILLLGIAPSAEEVLRIIAFALLVWVYLSLWLAVAITFSVLCRHGATAALSSIAIWLFFSLFMSVVAGAVADLLYPMDGIEGFANQMSNYQLELNLNRISPYYLFAEAGNTILNPSVRSIGIVTMSSYSGAVSSYLSFGQSLLLVWPHLVVMVALAMLGFLAAYVSFLRQEIRA